MWHKGCTHQGCGDPRRLDDAVIDIGVGLEAEGQQTWDVRMQMDLYPV